jgi:hypothetical protein
MQQAAETLNISSMVVCQLIAEKVLPAKQIVRFAALMIERHHLRLPSVRKAIRIVHSGRRSRITSDHAHEASETFSLNGRVVGVTLINFPQGHVA